MLPQGALCLVYCRVMFWRLWALRQDAFHHGSFGVAWLRALHTTGSLWGQTDQHRKGGLCRWHRCSPDSGWRLGDWALWFRSRECDAERWLLAACSWDCDWRRSNCPWGLFYVLVHVSWENTVARLHIDESVRPNETSSGSSECRSQHPTLWKYLSHGRYNPSMSLFRAASCTVPSFSISFLVNL